MGNLRGGPWALGATIFLGALCVADWFVRESRRDPPGRGDFTPDLILALHVLVNAAAIGTLLYGVASGRLPRWRVGDATLSTGLNSGVSGIVVAHELIHRRARAWRATGIGNLVMVNYAHFYIEHLKGHHRLVGTRGDPSTARPGETIYHNLVRSLPGQFVAALRIEADRLGKRGRARFGPANFVVATTCVQALIALAIGLGLGPRALTAYLTQGAIAVLLLQAVNYLQHSGLERPEGSRVAPAHSWQSDRVSGRFLLLELPRHADHHGHAAKPYHALVSHDESPTLPLGLLGTIPVLLIPPLWFALARRSQGVDVRS
jgi:alkane 1-monooxygenase